MASPTLPRPTRKLGSEQRGERGDVSALTTCGKCQRARSQHLRHHSPNLGVLSANAGPALAPALRSPVT